MRGDTALTIRLLLRGVGMAGLAATLGGAAALLALLVPWHDLVATVHLLDTTSSRTQSTVTPFPESWWGWGCVAGGLTAMWLGIGVAFDRPVTWARTGLTVATGLLVLASLGAVLAPPDVAAVLGADPTLTDLSDRLPTGVEMDLEVRASAGPWITLVAAGLVVAGALGTREHA